MVKDVYSDIVMATLLSNVHWATTSLLKRNLGNFHKIPELVSAQFLSVEESLKMVVSSQTTKSTQVNSALFSHAKRTSNQKIFRTRSTISLFQ